MSTQATKGDCSFCHEIDTEIVDISELFDFFRELLDNFQQKAGGIPLKSLIQTNWPLFSSEDLAIRILNYLTSHLGHTISSAEELVDFNEDILENVNYWDVLKEQLKWERRYLTDINHLTEDLGWDSFFGSQIILSPRTAYYRARLHEKSTDIPYEIVDMYCPPKHLATAGRANPRGIPFLYLSDDRETILYEIRAAYLDEVSIGTFSLKSSIVDDITIADFTETSTIFHPTRVNEKIKSTILKKRISIDLSKPLRRYDSELDYIPTQFICEFIKIYTGVHGIKFKSSLHTSGNNLVIFDQGLMECRSTEKVKVTAVTIVA